MDSLLMKFYRQFQVPYLLTKESARHDKKLSYTKKKLLMFAVYFNRFRTFSFRKSILKSTLVGGHLFQTFYSIRGVSLISRHIFRRNSSVPNCTFGIGIPALYQKKSHGPSTYSKQLLGMNQQERYGSNLHTLHQTLSQPFL